MSAGSFDMGGKVFFMQGIAEQIQVIEQGFAAGDHRYARRIFRGSLYDFTYPRYRVFIRFPAFFYIAPGAAYITASQPDKISRLPLVESFTLQGIKCFHERKGAAGI